ncbi:MAG: hypothetical protein LH609_21810 [Rudanella sp.]|nr:hypothetical protein [Rudanella sp.]
MNPQIPAPVEIIIFATDLFGNVRAADYAHELAKNSTPGKYSSTPVGRRPTRAKRRFRSG